MFEERALEGAHIDVMGIKGLAINNNIDSQEDFIRIAFHVRQA